MKKANQGCQVTRNFKQVHTNGRTNNQAHEETQHARGLCQSYHIVSSPRLASFPFHLPYAFTTRGTWGGGSKGEGGVWEGEEEGEGGHGWKEEEKAKAKGGRERNFETPPIDDKNSVFEKFRTIAERRQMILRRQCTLPYQPGRKHAGG